MPNKVAIALLLLLAVVLRAWDFPHRHELRHVDELPYVGGSLHLLEGMVPPYKYSPAGPHTWAGWLYAGGQTARYMVRPTAEERAVDVRVRPFVAANHAIWDNYADLGAMRWLWVLLTLPVVLWAIIELFKLGVYATGPRVDVAAADGVADRDFAVAAERNPAVAQSTGRDARSPMIDGPPIDGPPIADPSPPPPPTQPQPAAAGRPLRNPIGTAAGVLAAGFVAFMPLFVQLGGEGRPYVIGWCFGIIALCLAVRRPDPRGQVLSAITMGLAVASRIDMLMLLPVVWSEQFARRRERGFVRSFLGYHAIAAATSLLLAPWILTNLIGNLRIIATVRLSKPTQVVHLADTVRDFALVQGLWMLPLLVLVGVLWPRRGQRVPRLLLAAYVVLVGLSIFKATGFGLQHQGGPLVILIVMSAFALRPLTRLGARGAPVAWAVCLLALVVPASAAVRSVALRQRAYVDDAQAVRWIERNVPPGTRVYAGLAIVNPLPTRAASDALWAEVNDDNAWEKKFLSGLSRFNLAAADIPRALSDENMLVERGNRRSWFILGSRGDHAGRPRYDVRVIAGSPIFGVHDLKEAFARTGGVILWRGRANDPEVAGLTPVRQWHAPDGEAGVFVFASPDVKLPAGATTAPTRTTAPAAAAPAAPGATTRPPRPAAATTPTTQSAP